MRRPAMPQGAEAFFDNTFDVHQAGNRLVGAVHWVVEDGCDDSRLAIEDSRNGNLRWVEDGV